MIADGALLIRDGLIVEVGPSRRVENLAAARGALPRSTPPAAWSCRDSSTATLISSIRRAVREEPTRKAPRAPCEPAARACWRRGRAPTSTRWRATAPRPSRSKTGCGPDEAAEVKALRVMAALRERPGRFGPHFPAADSARRLRCRRRADRRRSLRPASSGAAWRSSRTSGGTITPTRQDTYARYLQSAGALSGCGRKVHAEGPGCNTAAGSGHRTSRHQHRPPGAHHGRRRAAALERAHGRDPDALGRAAEVGTRRAGAVADRCRARRWRWRATSTRTTRPL